MIGLLITYMLVSFLIFSMVSGLLDLLQTYYWHLYLIKLLLLLIGLGLLKLWHLINPRLSAVCGILFFFTNSNFMEFQARYLVLFCLFSVIDNFRWFWMENLLKSIKSLLEFLKAPTLFLLYINDFLGIWIRVLLLSLLLKLPTRKLESSFVLWSVFLLRLLFILIILPHSLSWCNTVVMSGQMLLAISCICYINYRNR